jgi:hypothetical protein
MDKMVNRGRLSIHLQNASQLSKEWGEGHTPRNSYLTFRAQDFLSPLSFSALANLLFIYSAASAALFPRDDLALIFLAMPTANPGQRKTWPVLKGLGKS